MLQGAACDCSNAVVSGPAARVPSAGRRIAAKEHRCGQYFQIVQMPLALSTFVESSPCSVILIDRRSFPRLPRIDSYTARPAEVLPRGREKSEGNANCDADDAAISVHYRERMRRQRCRRPCCCPNTDHNSCVFPGTPDATCIKAIEKRTHNITRALQIVDSFEQGKNIDPRTPDPAFRN